MTQLILFAYFDGSCDVDLIFDEESLVKKTLRVKIISQRPHSMLFNTGQNPVLVGRGIRIGRLRLGSIFLEMVDFRFISIILGAFLF